MQLADNKERGQNRLLVFLLAWKDLGHEWILSLCLVMAVTAVLGPIFILFGLKFGSMELLRNRLIEDPRNREVRPTASAHYEKQWFTETAARPDVSFVIPMTRQISTAVHACLVQQGGETCHDKGANIDLLATAANDPLLLENSGQVPRQDQCALTVTAAEKLGASEGAILNITVKRVIGGKYEKVHRHLKVSSVLDARAGMIPAIFVQLPMLEAVEQYKDGAAVPAYGWPGKARGAYPLFDGVVIWSPTPLSLVEQLRLKSKSGFSDIAALTSAELTEKTAIRMDKEGQCYLLTTRKKGVGGANVQTIVHRLRGKNARVFPWVRPLAATITREDSSEQKIILKTLGYGAKASGQLALSPQTFWEDLTKQPQAHWLVALSPQQSPEEKQQLTLTVHQGEHSLQLPITLHGQLSRETQEIYIPAELGGILRLLAERQIGFLPETEKFVLARQGYAGFRLYAASIDQVADLEEDFTGQGISVTTQAERIRDVKELNYYLTLIFWIITAAAALGGAATLAASLYGSVERKRREIAVLRLLGFSQMRLLAFPLYQGILLSLGGLVVAAGFFYLLAGLINHLFAHMIRENESLCTLAPIHLVWFFAGIICIAIVAAIGAAWRVTRLELVEALRDE